MSNKRLSMEDMSTPAEKPERLYFQTYLQLIRNSVGTSMFRNFYIRYPDGKEVDAMSDGSNSCAFYVSSVLKLFNLQSDIHGTVNSVLKDLEQNSWIAIPEKEIQEGDV